MTTEYVVTRRKPRYSRFRRHTSIAHSYLAFSYLISSPNQMYFCSLHEFPAVRRHDAGKGSIKIVVQVAVRIPTGFCSVVYFPTGVSGSDNTLSDIDIGGLVCFLQYVGPVDSMYCYYPLFHPPLKWPSWRDHDINSPISS